MANKTLTKSNLARLRDARRWSEADAREVLGALESSGRTIHAFAREHDLKAHRLYWWRQRLAGAVRKEREDAETLTFAPVVVTGLGPAPALTVRLGALELDVFTPSTVDPVWLAQIIEATKGER